MKSGFEHVAKYYLTEKARVFAGNKLAKFLRDEFPIKLKKAAYITDEYLVEGSPGKGVWTETPWVAVFDKDITDSAQHGFYPVYLFSANFKSVYLSLNQGWKQYGDRYKPKAEARNKIKENSLKISSILKSTPKDFQISTINLMAETDNAIGYELGHVCGIKYDLNNMPEELVLINDLRNMLGVYRELKGKIGADVLNLENFEYNNTDEEAAPEQEKIVQDCLANKELDQDIENALIEIENKFKVAPPERKKRIAYAISRNKKLANLVKRKAGFKCQICSEPGFEKMNGGLYAEAHHVWELGQNGYDVPSNLVCVCPNCHKKLHFGKPLAK